MPHCWKSHVTAHLIVFLLSCCCYCSVSFPHDVVGWSVFVVFPVKYDYKLSQKTMSTLSIYKIAILKKSKEEGKDQESIQSNTTPDPGHHMG